MPNKVPNDLSIEIQTKLLLNEFDHTTKLPKIEIQDWVGIKLGPNDNEMKMGCVLFKKNNGDCAEEYIIQIYESLNRMKPFREIVKIGPCEIVSHVPV